MGSCREKPITNNKMKFLFLKKNIDQTQKGFTLLEVLIAITILIFAITATFTAAQSGLQSSIESKEQVIAYYMAQEAVEFIRNVRDTNSLAGVTWLTGVADQAGDPCYPGKACSVDVIANKLSSCPSGPGSCANLVQDSSSSSSTYGMYGDAYNGHPVSWTSVNFKREIRVVVVNSNEIQVTVDVTWNRGSFSRVFTVHESIFNWQS